MPGEAEDPFTYAQIRLLMAMFALLWRCTGVASRLLRSVSYIVERNGLRFATEDTLARARHGLDVSRVTPVPEFSEPDYERVVFLSTCLGADAGLQLFGLQRRAELSWLDLERQFFDELPVRVLQHTSALGVVRFDVVPILGCVPYFGTDASRVA